MKNYLLTAEVDRLNEIVMNIKSENDYLKENMQKLSQETIEIKRNSELEFRQAMVFPLI